MEALLKYACGEYGLAADPGPRTTDPYLLPIDGGLKVFIDDGVREFSSRFGLIGIIALRFSSSFSYAIPWDTSTSLNAMFSR